MTTTTATLVPHPTGGPRRRSAVLKALAWVVAIVAVCAPLAVANNRKAV